MPAALTDAERTRYQRGLEDENATRRQHGLAELTLDEYIAAGYRPGTYYSADRPSGAAAGGRVGPPIDSVAAFDRLNTPYFERLGMGSGARQDSTASNIRPEQAARASGNIDAPAIFAALNERYERAIARARVGGAGVPAA